MAVAQTRTLLPADQVAARLLNHDHWEGGRRILRAIFNPRARVAVKGCHASGKTFAAADAVLLALFDGAEVITTAPTDDQVKGIMWRRIHDAIKGSRVGNWGEVLQKQITTPDGLVALGRSTNQGVRFQGYHISDDSYLLIVLDEGPGIEADVLEAIEGIAAAGDVRMLFMGNPTESGGPFYDVFDSPLWVKQTISAWDMPNLDGVTQDELLAMADDELDDNPRPYLATRRWVRDRLLEWGETSPMYQARVLGEFPDNADTALIWRLWLRQSAEREPEARLCTAMTGGVDVAGPGEDLTTVHVRQDTDVVGIRGWADAEPFDAVIAYLRGFVHGGLKTVNVDSIGVGWHFYVALRDALKPLGVVVNPVNVATASHALSDDGKPMYANAKAEHYWHLRQAFHDGRVCGLTHEETRKQLGSLRYETKKGLITIESKEDMTKRGLSSPDYAEAMMLAWANVNAVPANIYDQSASMKVSLR